MKRTILKTIVNFFKKIAYQFKREPLAPAEADMLYQSCNTVQEKLIIWILQDSGIRVSELL